MSTRPVPCTGDRNKRRCANPDDVIVRGGHIDVVKLLVDSGAQIDNKDEVSTEPCMMLHRDSSLTLSICLPSLSHTLLLSCSCPSLSPLPCLVIASLFSSHYSVPGVEVVGMCAWCLEGNFLSSCIVFY